jgi:methylthioribose-1-phosphate isomerase
MVKSIEWVGTNVRFLDQTRIPGSEEYIVTADYRKIISAIQSLSIRGAPLIGIAGAYAVVLAAHEFNDPGFEYWNTHLREAARVIGTARPTAVNLSWATERMIDRLSGQSRIEEARNALLQEALAIHEEDRQMCSRIGAYGAVLVPQGARVLTHCNTGALATGGEGTAQSVITTSHREGKIVHVFADETRPLFQGARLTAWELSRAGIPVTVITDSSAAALMSSRKIDLVVVGADRIAANGDTANKIGTFALAIAAAYHQVPFYVAAPTSTIDPSIASGGEIQIEERSAHEVTHPAGIKMTPPEALAWAPAFDVTPSSLIAAIITDAGVHRPPYHFRSPSKVPIR